MKNEQNAGRHHPSEISTEHKKAEEAIKENDARLKLALDAGNYALFDWHIETGEIYFSPRYFTMLGYEPNELPQSYKTWEDLLHADDKEYAMDIIKKCVEGTIESYMMEFRLKTKSGEWKWIISKGKIVERDEAGKPLRMVGTQGDISERKLMEIELQKAQRLESIGTIVGGIAHDFNNILVGIVNNIYLSMMHISKDSKGYDNLKAAEKAVYRATDLTQQLLSFARGGDPDKKTASIVEIIKESAEFVLSGSSVSCEYHIANDILPIKVDEGQINQAMHNFILNATQAMPEGGTIHILIQNANIGPKTGLPISEGKYVKIVIQDQGTGIPKEDLQKIFDPYFTTKDTGKGLGLSMTYSIIHNHKGYISVESEIGSGTSFTIYLPAF